MYISLHCTTEVDGAIYINEKNDSVFVYILADTKQIYSQRSSIYQKAQYLCNTVRVRKGTMGEFNMACTPIFWHADVTIFVKITFATFYSPFAPLVTYKKRWEKGAVFRGGGRASHVLTDLQLAQIFICGAWLGQTL